MPRDASSSSIGYTGWISKPPKPPAFMARISRSSSGLATAGPNHHQRIMGRASGGGAARWAATSENLSKTVGADASVAAYVDAPCDKAASAHAAAKGLRGKRLLMRGLLETGWQNAPIDGA